MAFYLWAQKLRQSFEVNDFERIIFQIHFFGAEIARGRFDAVAELVSWQAGRAAQLDALVGPQKEIYLFWIDISLTSDSDFVPLLKLGFKEWSKSKSFVMLIINTNINLFLIQISSKPELSVIV